MRRHGDLFHSVKKESKAWVRKTAQTPSDLLEMYKLYREVKEKEGILSDNE